MVRQIISRAVLLVALAAPVAANATTALQDSMHEKLGDEAHASVNLLGGVADYTGTLGSTTIVGPTWGVNIDAMAKDLYGLELGYEGSKNPIDDPRLTQDHQSVWRHGVYGNAKLGPDISNFRPFILAGLQESYVNVTDGAQPVYRNDFMLELPVGAGLEYAVGGLKVGVRGTWRWLFFDEFAERTPSADNPSGGMLGGQVTAGGRF